MGSDLALTDVEVDFGGLRALAGVSIEFGGSDITGLVGPNGSGKSTLVNAISGAIRLTRGDVRVDGSLISGMASHKVVKRGVARTYQVPRPPKELTVREVLETTLTFVGRSTSLPDVLRSPEGIAKFCGMQAPSSTLCGGLSVPGLRRLELARALACGPSVLLLDEFMAGLTDQDMQDAICVLGRIREMGVGVLIIEHVMSVIRSVCSRLVVLDHGVVIADGEPAVVLGLGHVREAYLGVRDA